MSEAIITSRGQIILPADIRRFLGLGAQGRITFTPMPDGTVVLRAKNKSLVDIKGMLKPKSGKKVAIKAMSFSST